jgi:MoxR-like ATPase
LSDAQIQGRFQKIEKPWETYYPYIEPGILWWVFDREGAKNRGQASDSDKRIPLAHDPVIFEPDDEKNEASQSQRTVILIDEIDKADPDFPNNLLVPLGSRDFMVDDIQKRVTFQRSGDSVLEPEELPLVIITTNEERRLPQAFLRRCIVLEITPPNRERLIKIAKTTEGNEHNELYEKVADIFESFQQTDTQKRHPDVPMNIAEYLDAVRACLRLKINAKSSHLKSIVEMTSLKRADLR